MAATTRFNSRADLRAVSRNRLWSGARTAGQQIEGAYDSVERSAQFMAYQRQEGGFGLLSLSALPPKPPEGRRRRGAGPRRHGRSRLRRHRRRLRNTRSSPARHRGRIPARGAGSGLPLSTTAAQQSMRPLSAVPGNVVSSFRPIRTSALRPRIFSPSGLILIQRKSTIRPAALRMARSSATPSSAEFRTPASTFSADTRWVEVSPAAKTGRPDPNVGRLPDGG